VSSKYPHPLNDDILRALSQGPHTIPELARKTGRAADTIRQIIKSMMDHGHDLPNLVLIQPFRTAPKSPDAARPAKLCPKCKIPGQMPHASSKTCTSCSVESRNVFPCPDDARWKQILAAHKGDDSCVICNSPNAKHRDQRYCHWTHDPTMLNEPELEELLNKFVPVPRDIWGRLIPAQKDNDSERILQSFQN